MDWVTPEQDQDDPPLSQRTSIVRVDHPVTLAESITPGGGSKLMAQRVGAPPSRHDQPLLGKGGEHNDEDGDKQERDDTTVF